MMGRQKGKQGKLFYYNFCLDDKVRKDHSLRKTAALIDFDFIYEEVSDKYGGNGNAKNKGVKSLVDLIIPLY